MDKSLNYLTWETFVSAEYNGWFIAAVLSTILLIFILRRVQSIMNHLNIEPPKPIIVKLIEYVKQFI